MFSEINILVLIFASLGLWVILLVIETLQRMGFMKGEFSRKAIHIYTGFFLALLPVFATRQEIIAINFLFFLGVITLSGYLHFFKSIESIKRWSLGHFLYPIGVLLVALFFKDPAVYSFSVLVLALADGFAAVFGKKYGKIHYHILGADKTLLGSTVFFLISLTLLLTFSTSYGVHDNLSYLFIFSGALSLTLIEGFIAAGFDNLVLPLVAAAIFSAL